MNYDEETNAVFESKSIAEFSKGIKPKADSLSDIDYDSEKDLERKKYEEDCEQRKNLETILYTSIHYSVNSIMQSTNGIAASPNKRSELADYKNTAKRLLTAIGHEKEMANEVSDYHKKTARDKIKTFAAIFIGGFISGFSNFVNPSLQYALLGIDTLLLFYAFKTGSQVITRNKTFHSFFHLENLLTPQFLQEGRTYRKQTKTFKEDAFTLARYEEANNIAFSYLLFSCSNSVKKNLHNIAELCALDERIWTYEETHDS